MSARTALASQLATQLELVDLELLVVDDYRELGDVDPGLDGVVTVNVSKHTRLARLSGWRHEFVVWVLTLKSDPADVETQLELLLDPVVGALEAIDWLLVQDAQRDVHPSDYHGYRIAVTAESTT